MFPALLTFTGDGIVLADEPPLLYETTGHGAWTAAGKSGADFTFVSLVGSESGALSATMRVAGSLKYDAAADTWQGTFTYLFTDAGGAEVAVDEGTMDAVRIGVEAPKAAVASSAMLGPGAKVGEMVLSKGPDPFDLNIPPIYAFCNPNPQLVDGSKVGMPGVYTVECSLPPLPQLMIGFGWVTDTKAHLDEHWSNISTELYVNGKQVDQAAFGSLDATVPNTGLPGEDPNKVVETPLRTWNVMLENLQAGPLELRFILNVAKDVSDEMMTSPAGIYDITYKITVDPALAAPEGTPAPVALVPELISVFDGFNAAVNAHDVDKALSYFAEDAVASFPNNLPDPTSFAGKDELRTWLATDADNNIHVETSGEKTSGDTLTATVIAHGGRPAPRLCPRRHRGGNRPGRQDSDLHLHPERRNHRAAEGARLAVARKPHLLECPLLPGGSPGTFATIARLDPGTAQHHTALPRSICAEPGTFPHPHITRTKSGAASL